MKKLSNQVVSNQIGIHENLETIVLKNKHANFLKPYTEVALNIFTNIESWILEQGERPLILDLCCGVGESTFHLANQYPDNLVIGMDKSLDRIERNNAFKKSLPENMYLVRADIIDLLRQFAEKKAKYQIEKIMIYYPNPYPKQKHLKLRWYGHPLFKTIMDFHCPIEVRSNWKLYLEEFSVAALLYGDFEIITEEYIPEIMITPFERKFANSFHQLYRTSLKPL